MVSLTPGLLRRCMPQAPAAACEAWAPAFDAAAKEFGISADDDSLAAWLASMGNESGQLTRFEELSYFGTPADRIRLVFGWQAPDEATLNAWKAKGRQFFDEAFFNHLYGNVLGVALGNDQPGEGYRYRGRGPGQITGKRNVAFVSKGTGVDFLSHPEKLQEPVDGARAFAYFFTATGVSAIASAGTESSFLRAMRAMNSGLREDEFHKHHLRRWHEVRRGLGLEPDIATLQRALMAAGFDLPRFGADGDLGNETRSAIKAFQIANSLPVTGDPDKATLAALGVG